MIHRRWMNLFFSAAAIELQKSINRLVVNYLKGICKAIKLEIMLGIWSRLIFDYVNFSERNSKLPVSIKQTHIHPLTRTAAAADTHTQVACTKYRQFTGQFDFIDLHASGCCTQFPRINILICVLCFMYPVVLLRRTWLISSFLSIQSCSHTVCRFVRMIQSKYKC